MACSAFLSWELPSFADGTGLSEAQFAELIEGCCQLDRRDAGVYAAIRHRFCPDGQRSSSGRVSPYPDVLVGKEGALDSQRETCEAADLRDHRAHRGRAADPPVF